jgi:TolB-like protein/Tfp pilus assembly protein PilF/tRNA A-37 threonylcarbamoyl transferase component Bud32
MLQGLMTQLLEQLRGAVRDRYAVDREVGRGGMATVFLAQDLKHDRRVALKVLHPVLAATLGADRFLREIQIAARLQHPHILPLYDSGQADTLLYYVMPFVEGESLRDRLNKGGYLPVEEAVKFARDVAAALEYAHRQGVVHRDIKPENVMVHEGEAVVTDFGIAKAVSAAGRESLTQTGMAVGTPAYMSPEQATGEGEPDGRTDLYSLGCVLFEMLSGSAPFTGSTVQALITKRFTEPVPSVRAARKEVSNELEQVVTRSLARDPADRFATASQVVQALESPRIVTPHATPLVSPAAAGRKSIAVLPFADMSPQKDQDYFCEGIAEEIINALAKIQALQVASRSSAFAFKGHQDVRKVGEQLGVGTVLEGSVRKAGNRLRITAQLVNVADGYHLWSERYDRDMEDVFAIQDEIAQNIVKALRVMLSDEEKKAIEQAPTADVQAYDYYLRGRQFFHQFRRTGIQFARRMFERAMEIDPKYAIAHAGAADCCSFLYMYWDGSRANLEGADSHSRQALEFGPELAEAHASRGLALSLSKRYEESEREFATAIRLNPKLFEAHYFYGRALFQQGKHREAIEQYQEASRVRPEDYQAAFLVVQSLRTLHRDAEAEASQRRGIELAERHLELNPDDARALYLGAGALTQLGERERALEWAGRALALDPEDSGVLYNVACVYALGGQPDEAIECLEKAIQNGFGHRAWLENDSDFDSIRGDPRFASLLDRL